MLMVSLFWFVLSFAGPVVTVEGDSTCPAPAAVAARLGELLPGATSSAEPDVALLDDQSTSVRIQVRRADGTPIGERVLDRTFPCPDLAAAAAVIIASWESDVHPEFRQALPAPPRPPVVAAPAAPVKTQSASSSFDLGAAVTGALAPSSGEAGAAVGALVVGSWTASGQGLGGRLAAQAGSERTLTLAASTTSTGAVQWRRLAASAGPQWRLATAGRGAFLDLHADALAAWVRATGSGFTGADRRDSGFDVGVGLGARLLLPGRTLAPWVDLSACGWLRQQVAYESMSGASVSLPRIEGTLALGISFCACP